MVTSSARAAKFDGQKTDVFFSSSILVVRIIKVWIEISAPNFLGAAGRTLAKRSLHRNRMAGARRRALKIGTRKTIAPQKMKASRIEPEIDADKTDSSSFFVESTAEASAKPTLPAPEPIASMETAPTIVSAAPAAAPLPAPLAATFRRFSLPALCGGVLVLAGFLFFLPALVGISLSLTVPLAIVSAIVTAHVFAMASVAPEPAATIA